MSPATVTQAQKMVAEFSRLRPPTTPVVIARDIDGWWAIYDAEANWSDATWHCLGDPSIQAGELKQRVAAVMASEAEGHDLPEWDIDADVPIALPGAEDDEFGTTLIALVLVAEHPNGTQSLLFPVMESIESDGESDVEEVFFLGSHVRPCGPVLGDRLQEIVDAGDHECPNASRRTSKWIHSHTASKVMRKYLPLVESLVEYSHDGFFDYLSFSYQDDDPQAISQAHHFMFIRPPEQGWHCKATHLFSPPDDVDGRVCDHESLVGRKWRPVTGPNDPDEDKEVLEQELTELLFDGVSTRSSPPDGFADGDPEGPFCSCVRPDLDYFAFTAGEEATAPAARHAIEAIRLARESMEQGKQECRWSSDGQNNDAGTTPAAVVLTEAANEAWEADLISLLIGLKNVIALLPAADQECIGFGCDPDEALTGAALKWMEAAEQVAALWLTAAAAHRCIEQVSAYAKKHPVPMSDIGCEEIIADLSHTARSDLRYDPAGAGRAVDLLLRSLSKPRPVDGVRQVSTAGRLRSLAAKTRNAASVALQRAALSDLFGVFADLAERPEWHSDTGHYWHIREGDDAPSLMLMGRSSQHPPFLMISPPTKGPMAATWELDGHGAHWADVAASYGIDAGITPVGDAYETCPMCGCPLYAEDEPSTTDCPNCGAAVDSMRLDDTAKAAHAVTASFHSDTAAVAAAINLDTEFIAWRDRQLRIVL